MEMIEGRIGRIVVNKTIKMKTIVRILKMIKTRFRYKKKINNESNPRTEKTFNNFKCKVYPPEKKINIYKGVIRNRGLYLGKLEEV